VSTDVEGPAPFVADVPVSSLSPDRSYRIEIDFDGKPVNIGPPLVVRTAPQAGEETAHVVAVTGGIDASDNKKKVDGTAGILKIKPQMALMLGDVGQLPAAERDFPKTRRDAFAVMTAMHEGVRNHPSMKTFFREVPCLGVWGERDFGPENSNKAFVYARESKIAFSRYWPNPMYGTPEARGVFFNAQMGDVDYFCLDARMQRDPGKSYFGEKQLEWLKEQLKASKGAIKIIASSSPMLGDDPSGWAASKDEREDFIAFLQKEKIGGVVFVSRGAYGEIICRKTKNDLFYPLYELVSPPLNMAVGKAGVEANRVGEAVVENGFGSLNFGGAKIKRFVTLQIRDVEGNIKADQTIFTASLQAP
jgi:hypothetical protein